ncbi:MAG: SseB family protein [Clostridia bacterium]|nr:SseB family protein [Clostridia bacterium]NCC44814.1 SseB family protein [Clostridia bacterium]
MTVNNVFIIRRLQGLDEMFVAFSAVTRMPYATCDEETFNDQVWIFTDQEKVQEFAKSHTEKKILIMGVKVKKEEAPMFYMNLFSMGINEIVFQDGEAQHKLELTSVVKMPDYEKLEEKQRPILNPQLQLSAIYFLQQLRRPGVEPDKAALKELEEEMSVNLVKSKYLLPVDIQEGKDGESTPENIRLIYVQNKEGERFQPIFSDTGELMKHYRNKEQKHRLLQPTFEQLPKYMIKDVQGYVLNPEGINLILKKEQIEILLKYYNKQ